MTLRFKLFLILYGMLLFALALSAQNFGGDHDVLFHYWIAELAWQQPEYLLDLWGKPLFTVLMLLPVKVAGYTGVMLVNALLLLAALFCLDRIAKAEGWRYRWLIWLLPLLLRTFLSYHFRALTEPVAASLLVFTAYALYKRKWWAFYLLTGALYLIRYELIFLLPVAAFIAVVQRDKKGLWLLAVPLLYEVLAAIFLEQPWGFSLSGGYDTGASVYGSGSWDHFIQRARLMTGSDWLLILMGASALGWAFFSLKKVGQAHSKSWYAVSLFLSAAALGLFLLHSGVWALGVYASAGMERVLHPMFLPLVFLFLALLNRLNTVVATPLLLMVLFLQVQEVFWTQPKLTEHYVKSVFWPHPVQNALAENGLAMEADHLVNQPAVAFYSGLNLKAKPQLWQNEALCVEEAVQRRMPALIWLKKGQEGPSLKPALRQQVYPLPYGEELWLLRPVEE